MPDSSGWFAEICPMTPGRALAFEVTETLYSNRSAFQQIEVFKTRSCGTLLALDGIIQCAESDEFCYQEMLANIPAFAHPDPEKILVIGGGDGGILRELARHPGPREFHLCEIDEEVLSVSRRFFPGMACGFDDPRVCLHIGDGVEFVRQHPGSYDIIIVDSSDPVGPGEALFSDSFYAELRAALREGGIICTQAESVFIHSGFVASLMARASRFFESASYAYIQVPTYPGGGVGACVCSAGKQVKVPARLPSPELQAQLRYYTPQMHEAAFVLPHFARGLGINSY
ncbi:MAG: spermidine synthase [Lentisphaerae bacterium GWF2_52_8]|nr:MAG: spermidine synthase [Lentisphaerae bacterium GWF2_52_8]